MPVFAIVIATQPPPVFDIAPLWIVAAISTILGYIASRVRWYLGVAVAILSLLISFALLLEFSDPAMAGGLTIVYGHGPVLQARLASALIGIGCLCAVLFARFHAAR